MKATYRDFLEANPNCSKYEFNPDAIEIFNILSEDENIFKMAEFADNGKPALAGCVDVIETFFDNKTAPTIDLKDGFTRTVIGRMVKAVLTPFGYVPTIQKNLPKNCQTKYFTSASCYEMTGSASLQIVKRIEEIR